MTNFIFGADSFNCAFSPPSAGVRKLQPRDGTKLTWETGLWTIPGERTKSGRANIVPLVTYAVTLIEGLPSRGVSPFLFPSPHRPGRPINTVKSAWDALKVAAGLSETDLRPHDLRRTLASSMADQGHSILVIGKLLNHSNSEITGVYARVALEPLRLAMQSTLDAVFAARRAKRKVVRLSDRKQRAV